MGFLDRIKESVDVARGKKPPDLSKLTPEQRARYDKNLADRQQALDDAEVEWRRLDEMEAARRASLVIEDDSPPPPTAAERRAFAESADSKAALDAMRAAREGLWTTWSPRKLARELVNDMYEENFGRSLSDGRTPEERAGVATDEFDARVAARAAYRAAEPPDVVVSRVATRGTTQLDEVRAWLGATGLAARPDLVWSVHRVPDRISPNLSPRSEQGRVVEWEVVHAPVRLPPTDAAVALTSFDRRDRWIARRLGEPVPLDEDIGAWFVEWADVDPSRCFGLPRLLSARSYGGGGDGEAGSSRFAAVVAGVAVLHTPSPRAEQVRRHMEAERPLARPAGPGLLRIDRLDWAVLAEHVHPILLGAPSIPSPKPHLPSSPQELLLAYLEVVGIASADCAGAAATTDDHEVDGALGLGPKLPAADGKARRRAHLTQEIVVVYRDRPEYAAGRERWTAYQSNVLRARVDHATDRRAVLDVPSRTDNVIRAASNVLDAVVSPLDWLDAVQRAEPPFVEFPYCWPPVA